MQLRWTPDNGQAGDYELRFRAVDTADPDNVLVSEIVVPVTVFNQNRRPVVQAIENVAIARGEVLEIPLRATDPDGNPLDRKSVVEGKSVSVRLNIGGGP